MRDRLVRILVVALMCLPWLGGCETARIGSSENPAAQQTAAVASEPDTTGSVGTAPLEPAVITANTPTSTGLFGDGAHDDLSLGKKYYRENSFGLAEQHFRRAVEIGPKDLEAWIGLAAAYDKLRRFDLADRAYEQAIQLAGSTPEILNNQGYSYLLRGDHRRAREKLLAARAKDPSNPYVQNNLNLLDESFAKRKAAQ